VQFRVRTIAIEEQYAGSGSTGIGPEIAFNHLPPNHDERNKRVRRKHDESHQPGSVEVGLAYIHGRLEAQVEIFATALGVPTIELAERMGSLLSSPARGSVLGSLDPLPNLRRGATADDPVSRPLALASGSHGQPSRKVKHQIDRGVKTTRAHNSGWEALSPEDRKREMKRRRLVSIARGGRMGGGPHGHPPTPKEIREAKRELRALGVKVPRSKAAKIHTPEQVADSAA
jgi:hypothetical protein